ncbi:uncharacterized protein LOC144984158 [Oryzias latipes]
MATGFSVDHFIAHPSLTLLDTCRKCDLEQIASHFGISFSKPINKQALKDLLVGDLRRMGVIRLTVTEVPVLSADVASGIGGRERDSGAPHMGDRVHAETSPVLESDERLERGKPPFSLPRYDPLSPGSGGSRDGARLKVRLARLQLEAQERAQTRQIQLEIKRLEIEAETAVRIRQLELEAKAQLPVSSVDSANPPLGSSTTLLDAGREA